MLNCVLHLGLSSLFRGKLFVKLLSPAAEGGKALFEVGSHVGKGGELLADEGVLALGDFDGAEELFLLLGQGGLRAVLGAELHLDLFRLRHLLDLGEGEAEELAQASNLLDALDVFFGVETEAPVHACGRLEQSPFLVEAERALGDACTLGCLADLEMGLVRGLGGGVGLVRHVVLILPMSDLNVKVKIWRPLTGCEAST